MNRDRGVWQKPGDTLTGYIPVTLRWLVVALRRGVVSSAREPICAKVVAEDPSFKRNKNFARDMFNCGVAIIWQVPLWVIPIYVVFRSWKALWISILVLGVTSLILKFNWFDKLEDDDAANQRKPKKEMTDAVRAI